MDKGGAKAKRGYSGPTRGPESTELARYRLVYYYYYYV